MTPRTFSLALAVALASPAFADEGMWTFNDFPSKAVQKAYGFAPDAKWLDHVRLSSARVGFGASASFVSPDGLVMTNHHVAERCVAQLSTKEHDYMAAGFYAPALADELRCPEMEIDQLVSITDVTKEISQATRDVPQEKFADALKAKTATLEKACAVDEKTRCDVVSLYRGGEYDLYKYRRYGDVRLVFAAEFQAAAFGGDPDNFNFPRYALDVAFLRVYDGGAPAKTDSYLTWNAAGPKEGELTFTSGHPGRTLRLLTVAELEQERDEVLPDRLMYLAEMRGMLNQFATLGKEEHRMAVPELTGVENSYKAQRGRREALIDAAFFQTKVKAERELRRRVDASPELKKKYGGAWEAIDKAVREYRHTRTRYLYVEGERTAQGFHARSFSLARYLVRAADELRKPNEQRLRPYADANLPAMRQQLFSPAPVYPELDEATLTFSLTKLREALGTDDPFVKRILGNESPAEVAARAVRGTKIADVEFRKKLLDGGYEAMLASDDPMIRLAIAVEPEAQAVRAEHEAKVEVVTKKNGALIARALLELYGKGIYPDATSTLRLSYGTVKGWEEAGKTVAPFTTLAGAFERATGKEPYALAPTWIAAKERLDLSTPMNYVTTNDIIGGNSGSPVVNRAGEVVGLVFDGNIWSLGGEYGFDAAVNRTVCIHTGLITHALERIYKADRLLAELRGASKTAMPAAP